jgi:hypothetical protein
MSGKEPSDIGLFRAEFDLCMSILLNGFNLPSERRVALLTLVLSESKPTDTQDGNKYGGDGNLSVSQRVHPVSILAYSTR